jgi:hypothetical protein
LLEALRQGRYITIFNIRVNNCFSALGKETAMVEVTESASKAIKAFMAEKNLDSALRVYLQSGG